MTASRQLTLADLQRINLVGTSGCGKSTFGKQLAAILDSPYVEMDSLYHEPNWTEAEPEVFRERLADAIAGPRWVLDGNYHSKTFDLKWSRATMIVWLDMPFSINMYRAVCRAVNRSWTQKELWPGTGNRESFRQTFFSKDSMILWTAMSYRRLKKRYSALKSNPPAGVHFVRLRNPSEVANLLDQVRLLV
ncbi:shikimate kinase [Mariniblastus fucicola]|uniref:Topology modulation protein n=1 Tax=Mariniblastus fucicola TaxID=980251 RepID=A0A5B9PNE6_9BACT|nr:shikimate kinase [Mariniblastus fucicola]QEG23783.1 topology modulation protein [Mariniblastus fucicola]